jgi:hypothetical protein
MITNIHFFGCSFTAGDELIDDYFFPWKKDCLTADEYYNKRSLVFKIREKSDFYNKQNKE